MDPSRNTNSASLSTSFLFLLLITSPTIISSSPSLNYHNTFFPTSPSQPHHEPESDPTTMTLSMPLLHVDSLHPAKSSLTPTQLLRLRLRRDILRAEAHKHLRGPAQFNSSIYSGILQGSGEFFTRLMVGTPPQLAQFVVDTGSDLTWLQCMPCRDCFRQSDPVYDPTQSESFKLVPCDSKLCHAHRCRSKDSCHYNVEYGDYSYTKGELATETLTFRTTRLARVALGCGQENRGFFSGAGGLLGLGRGRLSLPAQKGRLFNRTFSYCLVNRYATNGSSWLMFGNPAVSVNAVYTPLVKGRGENMITFYTVRLIGISVGGKAVGLPEAAAEKEVIVDSGTPISRLSQGMYDAVRDAFKEENKNLIPADSPMPELFDTCYSIREGDEVSTVTLQFEGGAFMELPKTNCLVPLDEEGTYCFAFAGVTDGPGILGNTQQQGFRVVFDLEGEQVGFAPDSCVKPT
ncbi:eukaryotic aspartyl protease family protein [Striga asiatica]|uniref:Eukaryotic aspartyl protease family protein n=1 Tax=Striga asiatica TaxID=4170 RepID=A0A5A7PUT8_STRAF|nr:eukaryotic aspartyl protease family protein [Striga asiatica]